VSAATEPVDDWEIWCGCGFSLACLVAKSDPDRPWLTKLLTLKYPMPGVTQQRARAVFERSLRGGYLVALPTAVNSERTT
jgi:hypothetical protein